MTSASLAASHLSAFGASPLAPDSPPIDKSAYHLFHAVPSAALREMSTDRPDKTESPYTVDAGHFQLELDLAAHTREREKENGTTRLEREWAIAPINLKAGLCNRVDLQLVLETWAERRITTRTGAVRQQQRLQGFGDITTRLKFNFWGNDSGPTAFAAMPFLKVPTSQDHLGNHGVEGGLVLPLAVQLPAGASLGLMTEVDLNRDENGDRYHPEFVNSITIGRALLGDLAGYVEFFSQVSTESNSSWAGSIDLGLTYGLTQNIQLDAGVNIGITRSADDLNPFLGLSWRY